MKSRRMHSNFSRFFALLVWLGAIHLNLFVGLLIFSVGLEIKWKFTLLILWVSLGLLPTFSDSSAAVCVAKFVCTRAVSYFPISIHFEDVSDIDPNVAYVIGMEPHSVLPLGIVAIAKQSNLFPLKRAVGLATSAIFYVPILKHIWSSLGLVPATRRVFANCLRTGTTVTLIPGGVQECLHMSSEYEVAYLRKRFGFVKLAIQAGAPIIPAFVFGQTQTYRWWMPKGEWFKSLSRILGFAPLVFWGIYGSPIPFPHPMKLVIGRPIKVEQNDDPHYEEVQAVLKKYISAMELLFENHKHSSNSGHLHLKIL